MAEILTFGKKWSGASAPVSDAPYAIDLALGTGVLWSETLAPASIAASDWTNQELADLYRAVTLLGQSGIVLEIDRGLADEGDPWLVLCRADGEVFIHFCRIGGRYLLDSPALETCLRGYNFASLIDQFVASVAPAARPSNVIALRNSKVLLHPASMLAALIWSLYLLSDATLGQAHASEFGPAPDSIPHGDAPMATLDPTTLIIDSLIAGQDLAAGHPAVLEKLLTPLGADNQNLAPSSPIATGAQFLAALSAVALGVGFINAHLLSSIEPTGVPANAPTTDGPSVQALATLTTATLTASATQLPPTDTAPSDIPGATAAALAIIDPASAPDLLVADGVQIIHRHHLVTTPASQATDVAVTTDTEPTTAPSANIAPALASPPPEHHLATITQELDYFRSVASFGDLASYSLRGIDVRATFDVSTLPFSNADPIGGLTPSPDLVSLIEPVAKPIVSAISDLYSDSIRSFIDFLLNSGPDVELIASLDDIVLVDMSALDELSDNVYSRSWNFEDGGRIIAIGHMEMFASFGLA